MTDPTVTIHEFKSGREIHFPLTEFISLFSEVVDDGPCRLWCYLRFVEPDADKMLLVGDDPDDLRERIEAAKAAAAGTRRER